MISAKEAREQLESLESKTNKDMLIRVEASINKALEENMCYTYLNGKLTDVVENKLNELGYTITYVSDQRDGNYTTIAW